jgi:V-type H+-transporting ATPase subunit a
VPTYKEINPAVFACVTFPFLFGVMFGDIGHGFVLFLVGALLCLFDGPLRKASPAMEGVLMIRYIVLLMGFFATFNGLIYNDFMAIPIWLFKSCYHVVEDTSKHYVQDPKHHHEIPMKLTIVEDCVYPIGVDPAWYLGSNELTFLNSLKMKISVILGVLQMSLGVIMKGLNAIYFRNYLDFIFEFIPQIILLLVLFGYMDWLIIAKWLTNFTHIESRAPSVISTMIGVFLDFGKIPPGQVGVIGSDSTQTALSIICLVVALICVPTMLFPKPFILNSHLK